jgi:hypothetical protein
LLRCVLQAHKGDILRRAEASHTIPLHEVRALQKMSFLREVKRRLYVITVHCHGHLLYATIQVSSEQQLRDLLRVAEFFSNIIRYIFSEIVTAKQNKGMITVKIAY